MKNRRAFMVIALSLLAAIVLITFIPLLTTPVRRPTNMVKDYILKTTPIGTSIEEVIEIINNRNDWGLPMVSNEGFIPSPPFDVPGIAPPPIGEKTIRTNLGSYRAWYKWFPLMVWGVGATWVFDAYGKLIEVHIMKVGGI